MFSRRCAVHRVLVVGALPWVVASSKAQAVAPEVMPEVAPQVIAKSVVPSGISLLPANDLTVFLPNGKEETSMRIVPVEGQSFAQALQLTTKEQPKYTYYFQIGARTVAPVAKGDVMLATFWMRTLQTQTGYGRTNLIFEDANNYNKSVFYSAAATGAWKQFSVPFVAA